MSFFSSFFPAFNAVLIKFTIAATIPKTEKPIISQGCVLNCLSSHHPIARHSNIVSTICQPIVMKGEMSLSESASFLLKKNLRFLFLSGSNVFIIYFIYFIFCLIIFLLIYLIFVPNYSIHFLVYHFLLLIQNFLFAIFQICL